jgi:hypothetical protein
MRRSTRALAVAVALVLAGCGGSSDGSSAAQRSPSASPSPSPALALPAGSVTVLDPAVPLTKAYATTEFMPAMSLRLPADWTTAERDVSAFQVYAGDEEHELTFDHTYQQKETVEAAVARLKRTEGLVAGPVSEVPVGDRRGLAFLAKREGQFRLQFTDSGFHVPGGDDLEVMAVPLADGTTLSVFVTRRVGDGVVRPLEPTRRLAHRILATVTWR